MAKKKKIPPIAGADKIKKIDDRHLLPGLLIQGANDEILKQYSDYQLDRANEKFFLLKGVETSWQKLVEAHLKYKKFITDKLRGWD